ncbi:bacteriophage abortive infection AbiH family protein [Bacillus cereus group sp. MYBK69-2]|uniref:bacteriophage abortive infection AbiH family protein n=1 Tax=Bacillus cereus group TaxID=86661 RepID=UPI0026828154
MSKLFILGNGFDLAHHLPTSYEHFHEYLLETYPAVRGFSPTYNVSSYSTPDGGIEVDNDEAVSFITQAISDVDGDEWWNIESSLAYLPFEGYLSDLADNFDLDDDKELFRNVHRNEDTSNQFYLVMLKFHKFLVDWVRSIVISNTRPNARFEGLIDRENDFFLTFNYTCVLEDIYGAENVCHIHGAQYDFDSNILFGHGHVRNDFESRHIGATESLQKTHKLLEKDTNKALEYAEEFFDELTSVQEIYSFGFSFSKVDLIYIKRICEVCNTEKCTWYLSDYKYDETKELYKRRIKEAGFKGDFKVFSITENEDE